MAPQQALADDESVLGADRDDQPKACEQAGKKSSSQMMALGLGCAMGGGASVLI
jgi:hypothetical protein